MSTYGLIDNLLQASNGDDRVPKSNQWLKDSGINNHYKFFF